MIRAPADVAALLEYRGLPLPELLRTAATWVYTASPNNPYGAALDQALAERAASIPTWDEFLQPTMIGMVGTEGIDWEEGAVLNNKTRMELEQTGRDDRGGLVCQAEKLTVWAIRAALTSPHSPSSG